MPTIQRRISLTVLLALLAPALLAADAAPHRILAGIPNEPGGLSREERQLFHDRLRELEARIAESSLDVAAELVRAALADAPHAPAYPRTKHMNAYGGIMAAVLRGIHTLIKKPYESADLALLAEFVASVPEGYRGGGTWEQATLNWSSGFALVYDDETIARAADRANDRSLTPVERGLHLMVFRITPGKDWDHPRRQLALETYRPYLDPSAPPIMQHFATMTAQGLWDYDAIPSLKTLAFTSPSYRARGRANYLVNLFYDMGPRMQRKQGEVRYDLAGARAWRARREEFYREFHRMMGLEEIAEEEKARDPARRAREAREFRALSPVPQLPQPRPSQRVVPRDQ